jgi:hypothetical protein
MHWLSTFFYTEAKFGRLEKRIKNETKFLEEQPGTSFSATKE